MSRLLQISGGLFCLALVASHRVVSGAHHSGEATDVDTITHHSEVSNPFTSGITYLLKTAPAESVLIGLFRSELFNEALAFVSKSSFLEQMLQRTDLLTQRVCGMKAYSDIKMAGLDLGDWPLRLVRMSCDEKCKGRLAAAEDTRSDAYDPSGGMAGRLIDMKELLKKPGMPELFLQELQAAPGLQKGLTPERMEKAFGQIRITARPIIQKHSLPSQVDIKVLHMRKVKDYVPVQQDASSLEAMSGTASKLTYMIDTLGAKWPETLQKLLAETLYGFTPALLSEEIMLSPDFPLLLNAVLDQVEMDVSIRPLRIPATVTMSFAMDAARETKLCHGDVEEGADGQGERDKMNNKCYAAVKGATKRLATRTLGMGLFYGKEKCKCATGIVGENPKCAEFDRKFDPDELAGLWCECA